MHSPDLPRDALAGIRVADFCWAWAGSHATTILSFLGAEVVKIESQQHIDIARLSSLTTSQRFEGLDRSPVFNQINPGKLSLSLNLATPEGAELARRLIQVCDIVAQNMRPGAMEKLGLGYDHVKAVRPDIIYLSSSALGATGPLREYTGYAANFAGLSGLAHVTGYADGAPAEIRGEVDLFSATTAAFAVLAALHHRQATGEGQHIDLSSTEVNAALCGDVFLGAGRAAGPPSPLMGEGKDEGDPPHPFDLLSVPRAGRTALNPLPQWGEEDMQQHSRNNTGRQGGRLGNWDEVWSPHNCYRCLGEDQWLSLCVATEQEWNALVGTMGNPAWAREDRFADAVRRKQNEPELDRLIQAWTCERASYEAMQLLQRAGVAAFPSMTGKQMYEDPHLQARGAWQAMGHPVLGPQTVAAPPWKLSGTPARIKRGAPLFGEHNSYVLRELLGLSADEVAALEGGRVVW